MPPVLDVAIGTIFVFLLFSLVLSALNEVVLSFFDQRAKFLNKWRFGLRAKSAKAALWGKQKLGKQKAGMGPDHGPLTAETLKS